MRLCLLLSCLPDWVSNLQLNCSYLAFSERPFILSPIFADFKNDLSANLILGHLKLIMTTLPPLKLTLVRFTRGNYEVFVWMFA